MFDEYYCNSKSNCLYCLWNCRSDFYNTSIYIFKKITNIKEIKPIVCPLSFIMIAIALIPKNYAESKFYETQIYPYIMIGLVFFLSLFILLLAYFKKRKKVGVSNE